LQLYFNDSLGKSSGVFCLQTGFSIHQVTRNDIIGER